jgi:hypothetical protein
LIFRTSSSHQPSPTLLNPKPSEKCDEQLLERVVIATHAALMSCIKIQALSLEDPPADHVEHDPSRPFRLILPQIPLLWVSLVASQLALRIPQIRFIPSNRLCGSGEQGPYSQFAGRVCLSGTLRTLHCTSQPIASLQPCPTREHFPSERRRQQTLHFTALTQHPANTTTSHS